MAAPQLARVHTPLALLGKLRRGICALLRYNAVCSSVASTFNSARDRR
jgi:hypothetical protein